MLAIVFRDIERHRLIDETFNTGIMYPLYKKKDKTQIENYRPLTMLETDYKLFMYDHMKLAQVMLTYAEEE